MDRLKKLLTNDWFRAGLVAVGLLVLLHFFVLRWVTVRSTSMYATLYPGDLVGVARWPVWTGFVRGDIAVFRDPLQDRKAFERRQLLVKRIVGLPGDVIELRNGVLLVNGERVHYANETHSYLVRLRKGTDPTAVLRDLGLPPAFVPPGRGFIELPLNEAMADSIVERTDVVSAERMSSATGAPRHIFPFSPFFRWNSDDYGPLQVPARGDTVRIDDTTIPLYDRIISRYEGNKLEHDGRRLLLEGKPLERYIITKDYYFVLGDSRHYSADSRYWGFVPADHLVGRAGFVLVSQDPDNGVIRRGRVFKGL
ncbi:MAG: signal peptidase I [Flavobacteriales bacterium]|nr:signal peptidase I [Flavobacteriales bacterium]